jgi:hypothetical protein
LLSELSKAPFMPVFMWQIYKDSGAQAFQKLCNKPPPRERERGGGLLNLIKPPPLLLLCQASALAACIVLLHELVQLCCQCVAIGLLMCC